MPIFLFDSSFTVITSQTLKFWSFCWGCWYSRWFLTSLNSTDTGPNKSIHSCWNIVYWYLHYNLVRSKWSVKDTDAQPRSIGSDPTNFIPTAAYSECITIPLSLFYLTLWICHVHRDGFFWISLMQHSQTSVESHTHLKKRCQQAFLLTVKIPQLLISPVAVKEDVIAVVVQSVARMQISLLNSLCLHIAFAYSSNVRAMPCCVPWKQFFIWFSSHIQYHLKVWTHFLVPWNERKTVHELFINPFLSITKEVFAAPDRRSLQTYPIIYCIPLMSYDYGQTNDLQPGV